MYGRLLILLFAGIVLEQSAAERQIHRLVGGHIKLHNPDSSDSELLSASASASGSGREKKQQKLEEEEKKTLAQQVADGKYGLIQKELFTKPPKRPGVISYHDNPEVPKDNINNLGGLSKNEIWLAENHLLVIKGGTYSAHDDKLDNNSPAWPAIDDYKAPARQVKLPAHPKVPPPFPVQLSDDGPLQILGTNFTRTLNGSIEAAGYAVPPPEGYEPGTGPFFPTYYPDPANSSSGKNEVPNPAYPSGDYPPGAAPFLLNGTLPPYFASLPPGAAILPPPSNQTIEQYDEDDPSIYYPPPYSFYYPKDNNSLVPAGPLVPGIILPPPPDFFAPLDEITTTSRPFRQRVTTQQSPQIRPTTTPIPPTVVSAFKTKKPTKVEPIYIPDNEVKPMVTTVAPSVVTIVPVRQVNRTIQRPVVQRTKKPQSVTILRPVKPSTPKVYVYNNEVPNYNSQGQKTVISTTQVPLKAYYSTSNDIDTNSVTRGPEQFHIGVGTTKSTKSPQKLPAKYFYYEEERQSPREEPNTNIKQNQYQTTLRPYYEVPEFFVPQKPVRPVAQQKPQFVYVTSRPYNTQRPKFRFIQQTPKTDSFSLHIARLQKQIHQYYTTNRPSSSKPVYQYSFEAANYKPQKQFKPSPQIDDDEDKFRPIPKYSVQIQQAVEIIPTEAPTYQNTPPSPVYYQDNRYRESTTQRNNYNYEQQKPRYVQPAPTSRPISQFSFEATPNPNYKQYYSKPPENGYYEDVNQKYYSMFGQKLPGVTTQLPPRNHPTNSPVYTQVPEQQYPIQKPVSLQGDTLVNYVHPRPTINPDAELVQISPNYPRVSKYLPRQPQQYGRQGPNPELVKVPTAEGQPGSFISYQLPGDDGAHFYFLTPQLAQRRDQGVGYYYSRPNTSRIRRNEREGDKTR